MVPYELSKFQAATLTHAANDGTRAFIVMESAPTDSEERRKLHDKDLREMLALVDEGLLVDITENFDTIIEEERRKSGRGCRVMSLTDVAIMMFCSTKAKEVVN